MSQAAHHTVRVLDQEIDSIAVCPGHEDFVVVATYSLIKRESTKESGDRDLHEESLPETQHRVGSLQVLPVKYDQGSSLGTSTPFYWARKDLPCAVLDIRFHHTIPGLLGAATSTGELRFFDIVWLSSESGGGERVKIRSLGIAHVAGDVPLPLITQLGWIDVPHALSPARGQNVSTNVCLVTSDTTGQIKIARVTIGPTSFDLNSGQSANDEKTLPVEVVTIHKHLHGLEAWTATTIAATSSSDQSRQLVLSGGDDSYLIASMIEVDTSDTERLLVDLPSRVYLDKHTHSAGVVSILALAPVDANSVPVLTGSYDQHLRLFLMNPITNKFITATNLELEGGVWRISLLNTYVTNDNTVEASRDWILLVSAMHAGCYIVRLNLASMEGTLKWTWTIEARFQQPHESMVYASAAIENAKDVGRWTVVTTSFYDKRICVWDWTDQKGELRS